MRLMIAVSMNIDTGHIREGRGGHDLQEEIIDQDDIDPILDSRSHSRGRRRD